MHQYCWNLCCLVKTAVSVSVCLWVSVSLCLRLSTCSGQLCQFNILTMSVFACSTVYYCLACVYILIILLFFSPHVDRTFYNTEVVCIWAFNLTQTLYCDLLTSGLYTYYINTIGQLLEISVRRTHATCFYFTIFYIQIAGMFWKINKLWDISLPAACACSMAVVYIMQFYAANKMSCHGLLDMGSPHSIHDHATGRT